MPFALSDIPWKLDINPSSLSSLFQDSAKTTPVTADGNPVGAAVDVASSLNFTQATASQRLTYRSTGLNGFPSLRSLGTSSQVLTLPHASGGALNTLQTGSYTFASVFQQSNLNQYSTWFAKNPAANSRFWFLNFVGTPSFFGNSNVIRYASAGIGYSGGVAINTPYVFVHTYASTGTNTGTSRYYINGVLCAQKTGSHPALDTSNPWSLGGAVGAYWTGDLGRVLAVDSALSTSQAAEVSEALRAAFSLPAFLGLNTSQKIIFVGDSITFGQNGTGNNGYAPRAIALLGRSDVVHNFGVPGQTLAQIDSECAVRESFAGINDNDIFVVFAGTNSINAGITGAAGYTSLQSICTKIKAGGSARKIVLVTTLPRTSFTTQMEAERQTLNSSIRSGIGTTGDALADWGNDATMGQAGQSALTAYYSDGTHPTNAGHDIGAVYVKNALASLLPAAFNPALLSRRIRTGSQLTGFLKTGASL